MGTLPNTPPDGRKLAYVAFLGLRPAAIAVALKTLGERVGSATVIVGPEPTQDAHDALKRLKKYLCGIRIDLGKIDVGELACAITEVEPWLATARDNRQRCGFHVDPGFGYASAKLARDIARQQPDALFLSTPEDKLIEVGETGGATSGLKDLGLDCLLDLYGVQKCWETRRCDQWGKLPRDVVSKLALPNGNEEYPFVLDRAFERAGRLHGLCVLFDGSNPRPADKVRKDHRDRRYHGLNNLQPLLSYAPSESCPSHAVKTGLGEAICWDFDTIKHHQIARWVGPAMAAARRSQVTLKAGVFTGRGGGDTPLVAWMGLDPSATLSAIHTHRPSKLFVLVDQSHPDICELANRLATFACEFPVGSMQIVPATFSGEIVKGTAVSGLEPGFFNVTPGTRLEAARTAARYPNLALWSLDQQSGCAVEIGGHGSTRLAPVPLEHQLTVCVGPDSCWDQNFKDDEQSYLIDVLGPFLVRNYGALNPRTGSLGCWKLNESEFVWNRNGNKWEVKIDGGSRIFEWESGGRWFEELIAACVLRAAKAADADCEVRVGVPVHFSPRAIAAFAAIGEDQSRTDGDVVVRLGRDFLLLDAKTGKHPTAGRHRALTSARAAMLGRFCIPVAVRPWIDSPLSYPGGDVDELNLEILLDTGNLLSKLRGMVAARRARPVARGEI